MTQRTLTIVLFILSLPLVQNILVQSALAAELPVSINRGTRDDTFISTSADTATAALAENRGYSCIILNREYDPAVPKRFPVFAPTATGPSSQTITLTPTGTMKPGITVPNSLSSAQAFARVSLIAPETGNYTFTFDEAQPSGTAVPGSTVRCMDTTLYGGYNRFFANTVIVEITNQTSETITPFVTIIDSFGNVHVEQSPVPNGDGIVAQGRHDAIFPNLPAMTFGQIIVSYVGSVGALDAYVAEYDFDGSTLTLKRERPMDSTPILP